MNNIDAISALLGESAQYLLGHTCETIQKEDLHLPCPDHLDQVFSLSNRSVQVLRNITQIYASGRLSGTGYLSILPVDQGVEHSAGSAFASNPIYFDPENILKLALEAGCNAVATTFGGFALLSRKYAHRIPFIVKINHNDDLSQPVRSDYVRIRERSVEPGCSRCGCHYIFWQ